eukprot:GFUD01025990.1.p1 GENE.GFUD01025990.1~~GFUD01025990.1.p1  ORF type:complete len:1325 (+),score=327.53 GFUD01025990.1:258-4232(+)
MGPHLEELGQEPEHGSDNCNDKSELSSLLFKDSSEISTTQADSAYSSRGTSTYSSLTGTKQPSTSVFRKTGRVSFRSFKKLSSSSQLSGNSNSAPPAVTALPTASNESKFKASNIHEHTESLERTFRRKKTSGSGSQPSVEEQQNGFPNSNEKKALQVASLSQALGFVDEFRKSHALKTNRGTDESEINDLATNLLEASQGASVPSPGEFPESLDNKEGLSDEAFTDSQKKKEGDGFCVAVSLFDGMVMHTTSSLTTVLGYPKDMWVGRSFIDFVHPEDRGTFISQVTENISLPLRNMAESGKAYDKKELQTKSGSFFCRIRIYNGLKSGFSIKERKTRYNPFKLSVCFSEIDKDATNASNKTDAVPQSIYLFITAIPIRSAYSEPFEEGPVKLCTGQTGFISKHNAECKFSMFDEYSISYLGYLPQDISGDDIFKYIHPEDLGIIKEAFEAVMVEQGKPFKSKPVRFKIKNGGYITISSWWSSFINPWSRQLEFVHGKHTVVQGPKFPDIFSEVSSDEQISEKVSKQGELIQNEIKCTLRKTLLTSRMRNVNGISNQSTKNKKELSSFMGSLLEEVAKAENHKFGRTAKALVISNISPHYSDSSEAPPSYNQLTYNENLTRFFNSQPKTLSEKETMQASGGNVKTASQQFQQDSYGGSGQQGSNESKEKQKRGKSTNRSGDGERSANDSGSGEQGQTVSGSGEGNGNNSSTLQIGLSAGHNQQGGDDGMLSQDGTGSGSGSRLGSGSRASDGYKPPPLTEELIAVHNKDMEKRLLTKFKEAKRTGEMRFLKDTVKQKLALAAESKKLTISNVEDQMNRNEKNVKKPFNSDQHFQDPNLQTRHQTNMDTGMDQPRHLSEAQFGNYNIAHNTTMNTGMMRHVYSGQQNHMQFPGGLIQNPMQQDQHGFTNQFIGVPTVYIPIQGPNPSAPPQMAQGIMLQGRGARYVPMGMMYSPMETVAEEKDVSSKAGQTSGMQPELPNCLAVNSCMVVAQNPPKFARPVSRATSVKGEPGSALESNASASASVKAKGVETNTNRDRAQNLGNESDPTFSTSSSSLYSFLKTSDGGQSQGEDEKEKVKKKINYERPVLSEPFWNQRVKLNSEMIYNYQMENKDLEEILKKDREALSQMQQPEMVDDQLKDLFTELEDGVELEEFLVDFECPPTDDETETSADELSGAELEEKLFKIRRRKAHLEKMNIFMEAEAPFPIPDSPSLTHKKGNSLFFGSPQYSNTLPTHSGGSQNSEDSFETGRKHKSKTFRFGDTSSLGKCSFEKNGENSADEDSNDSSENKRKKTVASMTEITEETKSETEKDRKSVILHSQFC